jgi:hypothetical protein
MTQTEADALQEFSKLLWDSEVWRVVVNVQHRFEDGYEPSDMDSLRLDFRKLLPNPTSRLKQHRQTGSLWIDVNACGLRLERPGEVVAACGDSTDRVLAQFKQLVGKTLARIDITPPGGDTKFLLDDGLLLRCFPATSQCDSWGISSAEDAGLIIGTQQSAS